MSMTWILKFVILATLVFPIRSEIYIHEGPYYGSEDTYYSALNAMDAGDDVHIDTTIEGPTCTDLYDQCPVWQVEGRCRGLWAEVMKQNCMRSCNVDNCSGDDPNEKDVELTTARIVVDGVTKHLYVTCKHFMSRSDKESLGYLSLYKGAVNENHLAHLDFRTPNDVSVYNSMGAGVSGRLVPGGDSTLTYTWEYPSNDTAGDYTCKAGGRVLKVSYKSALKSFYRSALNSFMHTNTYATVTVQEISHDVDSLLKIVKTMLVCNASLDELEIITEKCKATAADMASQLDEEKSLIETCKANATDMAGQLDEQESLIETCKATATEMAGQLDELEIVTEKCKATATDMAGQLDEKESLIETCKATATEMAGQLDEKESIIETCMATTANQTHTIDKLNKRDDYLVHDFVYDFDKSFVYEEHKYVLSKAQIRVIKLQVQIICFSQGGYIVEIDNENEFKAIVKFLDDNDIGSIPLGATDEKTEGTWTFLSSGDPVTYFNWQYSPGSPHNVYENCMFLDGGLRRMKDSGCQLNTYWEAQQLLCEIH